MKAFLLNIIILVLLTLTLEQSGLAQTKTQSVSVNIDNDYLNFRGAGTDRYYTNGIHLAYSYLSEKKPRNFSSLLLRSRSGDKNIYSWGISQMMFTPSDISSSEILYNDRPYAGALFINHSLCSIDFDQKLMIKSEIYLGVIGPLSLADQSQIWMHTLINYKIPQGWDNQVPNDLIINYNIQLEKEILHPSSNLLLSSIFETFSGTLYNAAGIGFQLKAGRFKYDFSEKQTSTRKAYLYVSFRPVIRIVASNAVLEGGIIHQITQNFEGYTISKDQLKRITYLYDVGINLEFKRLKIHLIQKIRTPEFEGSFTQEIGNIKLEYSF